MDGDTDGNRSERSRVRENMEGVGLFRDRVQNVWGKNKKKKQKRRLYNKTSPKKMGPMAACIKRGLSPAQKKRGEMSKKRGLRAGLRPRV